MLQQGCPAFILSASCRALREAGASLSSFSYPGRVRKEWLLLSLKRGSSQAELENGVKERGGQLLR